jgi:hypothetical protein
VDGAPCHRANGDARKASGQGTLTCVEINRPASPVWAYVADYGNDTGWRAAVSQQIRPEETAP